MSITTYQTIRFDNITQVTVTSNLVGAVWYHWYLDGIYQGRSNGPARSFYLEVGEQARIEVIDTLDAGFDPIGGGPEPFPPRKTIYWWRSLSEDVRHYVVKQKKDAEAWISLGIVPRQRERWTYQLLTPRLVDLAQYQWQVMAVDTAGNESFGGGMMITDPKVVRRPDAPNFSVSYDPGTRQVTFSAA